MPRPSRREQRAALTGRLVRAALAGAIVGLALSTPFVTREGSAPELVLLPFDRRIGLGFVAGGAVAGVLLAGLRDRMTTGLRAAALGIAAVLGGMAVLRFSMLHALPWSPASLVFPALLSVSIGAIAGLLARDVAAVDSARRPRPAGDRPEAAPESAVSLIHRLVRWSRTPGMRTRRRRREVASRPFPAEWLPALTSALPLLDRLPVVDQQALREHILVFLDEKSFEGCDGLEITDEIRVTIAAQACLLALRHDDLYPGLRSILVYPSTYLKPERDAGHGNLPRPATATLGESWAHGTVVLAWDSVRLGAGIPTDGQNVVIHEFAHQLDQDDGRADGQPFLPRLSAFGAWSRVMEVSYRDHLKRSRTGRTRVLDEYGAKNPAEFFAVATEAFFERPRDLKRAYPELYEELAGYYLQDPAAWSRSRKT